MAKSNEKKAINNVVGRNGKRKLKIVFARKKYDKSEITNVTMRALFKSAMVRIEATKKMFSERKSAYKEIAYNVVRITREISRAGVKK